MPPKNKLGVADLLRIGMEDAAQWVPDGKKLRHEGNSRANWRRLTAFPNSLYAFVCEGEVLYIGKTTQSLHKRFAGYCDPGTGHELEVPSGHQKTDRRGQGSKDLRPAADHSPEWGGYPVNLSAGLEDALVKAFQPAWNGSNAKFLSESEVIEQITK